MKTALIIGCKGQDGTFLSQLLVLRGYHVIGLNSTNIESNLGNKYIPVDLKKNEQVYELIKIILPDEIYYLAAYHHSSESIFPENDLLYIESHSINTLGVFNVLEAMRKYSSHSKLFYAASSHVFAETKTNIQCEQTPFCPDSFYGITKLDGLLLCRYFREKFELFCSTGILYNHESHLRRHNFLFKKVITSAIAIKRGELDILDLGDLSVKVDWGYAPDFVEAMFKIVQLPYPDEFIVATGKKHSVDEFVKQVFHILSLDYTLYVREKKDVLSKRILNLCGDSTKLRKATGWIPKVKFEEMVDKLVQYELQKINQE